MIAGKYTHIIVSPEAITESNRAIFEDPQVADRLCLLAVENCHLVRENFREHGSNLLSFCTLISRSAPCFAFSASITPINLEFLKHNLYNLLVEEPKVVKVSIDRPELYYDSGAGSGDFINDMQNFVLKYVREAVEGGAPSKHARPKHRPARGKAQPPPAIREMMRKKKAEQSGASASEAPNSEKVAQDMPKTIVFVKDAATTSEFRDLLVDHIEKEYRLDGEVVRQMIVPFNEQMNAQLRQENLTEFRKPDSKIRIALATEVLGTGVSVPDVKMAIQYGEAPIDLVMQRFGRAARTPGMEGTGVYLALSA
ncbi:hypothetical protein TRVA0_076S00342 [Trichomonascus vanleenenianus]|uniref:DEAD/DEAH box helicase n=1 Tax=Trichomonascus vanleenenianus TaxID=2268995 RepID=UPI003ECA3F1C